MFLEVFDFCEYGLSPEFREVAFKALLEVLGRWYVTGVDTFQAFDDEHLFRKVG